MSSVEAVRLEAVIRVGPAGWKYKDWGGIVYPKPEPRGFDELSYLAQYFNAIEINTSYYGPPRPTTARKWIESIAGNSAFKFSAKLFHSFTHERNAAPNDEREFKDGIDPLAKRGPARSAADAVSMVLQVFA